MNNEKVLGFEPHFLHFIAGLHLNRKRDDLLNLFPDHLLNAVYI